MVVVRYVVDVLFGALLLGEVVGDAEESGDGFVRIAKGADDKLHRDTRSILANVGPLPFVDEAFFRGETKDVVVGLNVETEL